MAYVLFLSLDKTKSLLFAGARKASPVKKSLPTDTYVKPHPMRGQLRLDLDCHVSRKQVMSDEPMEQSAFGANGTSHDFR